MSARQQSSTDYPITFLMVLSIDHLTGATGKTPTVTLSKNGGAFGAAAGAVSEVGNGIYALTGNATDRNTLGELRIHATATGCDPVDMVVDVTTGNPFASASVDLTPVTAVLDKFHFTGAEGAEKVNSTLGADLDAKIAAIGTSAAYAVSPTIAANTVRIVRGDSYLAANGRSIRLTYSGQPDFTSATGVTLKAVKSNKQTGTTVLTLTGTVYSSDTLEFQPDTVDTSGTELSTTSATQLVFPMEVSLTLSNSKVITPTSLNVGRLIVDQQAP